MNGDPTGPLRVFCRVQFIAHSATVRKMKCAMNRAATVCATG